MLGLDVFLTYMQKRQKNTHTYTLPSYLLHTTTRIKTNKKKQRKKQNKNKQTKKRKKN